MFRNFALQNPESPHEGPEETGCRTGREEQHLAQVAEW